MAQSIYVTLETLKTETSVPEVKDKDGKVLRRNYGSVQHSLPRSNYPTAEIFDNEELFVEWAKENNCMLALLQAGISDYLISDRATFKAMVKGEWSPELGQKAVNERKWTISKRPQVGTSGKAVSTARYNDCLGMIGNLAAAQMDKAAIRKIVVPIYGDDMVGEVFTALEKAAN